MCKITWPISKGKFQTIKDFEYNNKEIKMISDSSPLIFLSKITALSLLKKLFTNIEIPKAVKEEILIKEKCRRHNCHLLFFIGDTPTGL